MGPEPSLADNFTFGHGVKGVALQEGQGIRRDARLSSTDDYLLCSCRPFSHSGGLGAEWVDLVSAGFAFESLIAHPSYGEVLMAGLRRGAVAA